MSYPENEKSQEQSTTASGGYQTTTDEETRKTGVATEVDAKESAKPESGSSESVVEGSPNQGTEKR